MFKSGYFDSGSYLKLDTILTPDRSAARITASELFDCQQLELQKIKPLLWVEIERRRDLKSNRVGGHPKRGCKLGSKNVKKVTEDIEDGLLADLIYDQF